MKCTNLIGSLSIGFLVAGISPISLIGEDYDRGEHSKIVTFSAPGAGTGAGQGTYAIGVNAEGSIVGYYIDENGGNHGFLRSRDGHFTTLDPAGSTFTRSPALNDEGFVAGFYKDATGVSHSFFRAPSGDITSFDAPGAGIGAGQGTRAKNINQFWAIAGFYLDAFGASHGFLRAPHGSVTTFSVPGAGTGPGQGTIVWVFSCLTDAGAITGSYVDANNVSHGFVRSPYGGITIFDAPGAGTASGQGTISYSINWAGTTTGVFLDSNNVNHGFLRAFDGKVTAFDVPGAGTGANQGTLPQGNNAIDVDVIEGSFVDVNNVSHGFVRDTFGEITTFDVPGAGKNANQGTFPASNNLQGAITGFYVDVSNVAHGFLRMP